MVPCCSSRFVALDLVCLDLEGIEQPLMWTRQRANDCA